MTRLIIGANPFGGYSHQTAERDQAMLDYYSVERIKETWAMAAAAGINTMVTNNETPHVLQAVREYLGAGGPLQWVAQINRRLKYDMDFAIREAVEIGCKAIYIHGALVDDAYARGDDGTVGSWCDLVRSYGIPVGVAAHDPWAHRWVDSLDIVDFHAVCFFNCGSLHQGKGEKFQLRDIELATETIRAIHKPCIAYKVMGAGRVDARMALDYAYASIKPSDVVNVGIYRGDRDDMVQANVAIASEVLESQRAEAASYV